MPFDLAQPEDGFVWQVVSLLLEAGARHGKPNWGFRVHGFQPGAAGRGRP